MVICKWISGASFGLALAAASVAHAAPSFPVGATGDWEGALASNGATTHVFIHIHRALAGGYVGAFDSPDRGAASIPIEPIAAADGALAFAAGEAQFRGDWNAARGEWQGTWTEANVSLPLTLKGDVDNITGSRIRRPN